MARYDNAMTAHVWAQQRTESGESHNGNMWFRGPVIYSYGTHFPLACFAKDGFAFVNGDSSSITTNGKHFPAVRRALGYQRQRMANLPALDEIIGVILEADEKGRLSRESDWRPVVTRYLANHWQRISAENEGAAWLLKAAASRGTWAAMRAKLETADAKEKAAKAKAERAALIAAGKESAALPLDALRARIIGQALGCSEWQTERVLNEWVSLLQRQHKAAPVGRIKAALWDRVKLARELRARLLKYSSQEKNRIRGHIATLRQLWRDNAAHGLPEKPRDAAALAARERDSIAYLLNNAPGLSGDLRAAGEERVGQLSHDLERLQIAAEAARMAEQEAARLAWLANSPDAPRYAHGLLDERGGALIRAIGAEIDGCRVVSGELETSQGARVPLSHAVRAFAFVRSIRERGQSWERKEGGPRVGHFQLDRVHANGDFEAGCHRINWNETERLARLLGVWDCPATALNVETEEKA